VLLVDEEKHDMKGERDPDRWARHLAAAEREGKTLVQYARERGVSVGSLYTARYLARRTRASHSTRSARLRDSTLRRAGGSPFVPIKLSSSVSLPETNARLRAQLPNGVALEVSLGDEHGALLRTLLETLAQLPCSD
jgi:hypothetical protein